MPLPNFLVIGAPKSGTTSLYEYLKQHPQVFLPDKKEPHFFSFEGRTCGYNGPGQEHFMKKRVTTFGAYQDLYRDTGDAVAIGDASTSYIHIPAAADRIKTYLPDVKMIAMLRHPVDRAFSHYLHHFRNGGELLISFEEAIAAEGDRQAQGWSPFWQYQDIGFYGRHLQRFFDVFDANNIRVYLFDDFIAHPETVTQDIFEFIGVDATLPAINTQTKHNVSYLKTKPRSALLHKLLNQENWLKGLAAKMLPMNFRRQLRGALSRQNTQKLSQPYKPVLDPAVRQRMTERYRADILALQDLLDRDLSHWLPERQPDGQG
jgi:hypothetical protein